jgi:hypothetical protein
MLSASGMMASLGPSITYVLAEFLVCPWVSMLYRAASKTDEP